MKVFVVLINFVLCFSLVSLEVETKTNSEENISNNDDEFATDVQFANIRNQSDKLQSNLSDVFDVVEQQIFENSNEFSVMPNDGPINDYKIPFTLSNYRKQHAQRAHAASFDPHDGTPYTRDIIVKQGRLKGSIRIMHPQSGLKNVDQYLGIPYAEAPVGTRRFMPPGAPIPWTGLKVATKLSPVCPQNLPSLNNANNNLSKGRYDQIKRLLPYLKIESEDCLYLNLYVPSYDGAGPQTKYPVIVYVHGESYEWNSGNPYDGSILASYGQVIVVTLNFRLGILGFMKPGISDHTVSNFGLLDQIAALQWVKENIGSFGGDNKLVTVMGHGTGAACVNFLMVSPVAKGLFHRAILMSGSALSDWALTNHHLQATMQVLQGLNCPLNEENDEMITCLRKKRYSEILGVKTSYPQFSTRFGPVVDGLVIPNTPHKVMGQYSDIFSGYDLLYGLTELESYNILNAIALTYGLLENERDNLLRFYMQNRFEIRPDLALAATLREYTDIYMDPNKALADEHRDTLLEVLSDARVAAPLVQTGLYLSKVNPKCYMYVFGHNSEAGEYGHMSQSVIGEDLAYVFGAPLGQVGPFQVHYNARERLFSEAIMKYFSNFAKTGNPKAPWKDMFLNMNPADWNFYDVDWPEFNNVNQSYLHMGITPVVGHRYRNKYMKFWNQELPEELRKITTSKAFSPYSEFFMPGHRKGTTPNPEIITGHINLFPIKVDIEKPTEDSFRALVSRMKDPLAGPGMYNAAATSNNQPSEETNNVVQVEPNDDNEVVKSELTLTILIGVAIVFLICNILIVIVYLMNRNAHNKKFKRNKDTTINEDLPDDKRTKFNDNDESYILEMMRKTNSYEPVKANQTQIGFNLSNQFSNDTVDAHTKVSDWISQDMNQNNQTSQSTLQLLSRSNMNFPQKVSVAIDATPQARSNSVLRQEPIEITKAKSFEYTDPLEFQENEREESPNGSIELRQCSSSSSSYSYSDNDIRTNQRHSKPESVPSYYNYQNKEEEITSFMEQEDINVTCRDMSIEKDLLSPEEALKVIQRRNFPKVLPDYPNEQYMNASMKRRSLPPQCFMMPFTSSLCRDRDSRYAPPPPPRISSTLGRRPSRKNSNFISSPPMMAEEPPIAEEPTISSNTLHIGPLLPKHHENTYMTISRQNSNESQNEDPVVDIICIEHKKGHENHIIKPSGIKPPSNSSFKFSPPKEILKIDTSHNEEVPVETIKEQRSPSKIPILKSNTDLSRDRDKSSSGSCSSTTETVSSTGTIKKIK